MVVMRFLLLANAKNEFVEPRFLNVFIHEKDSFDFFYPIVDGSVIFL